MNIFRWCNSHHGLFRIAIFILALFPAISLLWRLQIEQLGINPFETLIVETGISALVFLCLTLAITPCRRWFSFFSVYSKAKYGKRLSDWNFLIRSRRMLGLYTFFYACLHMLVYLYFEMDFDWQEILYEIRHRYFIAVGFVAWLIAALLAITSPTMIQRSMGKHWRRLHRGMYLLSIAAVLHIYLEAKLFTNRELIFTAVVVVLLIHRILVIAIRQWRRKQDDGMLDVR